MAILLWDTWNLILFLKSNIFITKLLFLKTSCHFFATLRTSPLLKVSQLEALHPVQQFLFLLPFAKNINVWQIKKMHFISSFFVKGLKDVPAAYSSLLLLLLFFSKRATKLHSISLPYLSVQRKMI